MGADVAGLLLNVMQLVDAGLSFISLVKKIEAMESAGATPDDVRKYLHQLRVEAQTAANAKLTELLSK